MIYNADPATELESLSPDEAQAIADNPKLLKSLEDKRHFALRSLATAVKVTTTRTSLTDEISRLQAMKTRGPAMGTALTPQQALEYLTNDEVEEIFSQFQKDRLEALESVQKRAETDAERYSTLLKSANKLVSDAASHPQLDSWTRERLGQLLTQLQNLEKEED